MAAITAAVVAAGATAYAANRQAAAADDAAKASQNATNATVGEQRRQFDLTRQDQMPWLQAGQSALGRLNAASTGDFSAFTESPGYQFRVDQGFQGLNRGAAANGSFGSGGADADRIALGQGLASAEFGDWWNRQAGLAGVGQSTASGLGSLGANMATNIGNAWQNNADNQRQSSYAKANANSQLAGGLAGLATGVANNWGTFGGQPAQQSQPFSWQPQQMGWQSGTSTLGPSNGSSWNFGGGS